MIRTVLLSILAFAAACAEDPPDLGGSRADAGASDAAAQPGPPSDAGLDAGAPSDGGSAADAGSAPALSRRATLTARSGDFLDALGSSVAFVDELLLAGAPNDEDDGTPSGLSCGSAVVFGPDAQGNMHEITRIVPPDPADDLQFGRSLAVFGGRIAIGAPGTGDPRAYVYRRVGNTFELETELFGPSDSGFGRSLGLQADLLVVGTPLRDRNRGGIVTYRRGPAGWAEIGVVSSTTAGAYLGVDVAVSADQLVAVGAPGLGADGVVRLYRPQQRGLMLVRTSPPPATRAGARATRAKTSGSRSRSRSTSCGSAPPTGVSTARSTATSSTPTT